MMNQENECRPAAQRPVETAVRHDGLWSIDFITFDRPYLDQRFELNARNFYEAIQKFKNEFPNSKIIKIEQIERTKVFFN